MNLMQFPATHWLTIMGALTGAPKLPGVHKNPHCRITPATLPARLDLARALNADRLDPGLLSRSEWIFLNHFAEAEPACWKRPGQPKEAILGAY